MCFYILFDICFIIVWDCSILLFFMESLWCSKGMYFLFFLFVLFKLIFLFFVLYVNLYVWEWLFDGIFCFGCLIEREEYLCNRGLFVFLEFCWLGLEFYFDFDIWWCFREEMLFRKIFLICEVCDILFLKWCLCCL